MLTVLGLILNIIGTVFVGFVVPQFQAAGYGGPIVTRKGGQRFSVVGWILLVAGFCFQLVGAVLHR